VSDERKIVIIAGPNGAGKTTFAREFLPNEANCPVFVNVDLIAAGLSPFQPEAVAVREWRMLSRTGEARLGCEYSFQRTPNLGHQLVTDSGGGCHETSTVDHGRSDAGATGDGARAGSHAERHRE
jgi:ABC-type branched-subunit amino acid transport system ATPase component